jgi:hypothetical protein
MKKGIKPKRGDVYKNIAMTRTQFTILSEEAKELTEGNLSMHIRNIFDQYIHKKSYFTQNAAH